MSHAQGSAKPWLQTRKFVLRLQENMDEATLKAVGDSRIYLMAQLYLSSTVTCLSTMTTLYASTSPTVRPAVNKSYEVNISTSVHCTDAACGILIENTPCTLSVPLHVTLLIICKFTAS